MRRMRSRFFIYIMALFILHLIFQIPTHAATTVSVPFISQVPPGDWTNTKNCGQTSCVMLEAFYRNTTPTSDRIKQVDDWLYNSSYRSPINNYNGSYTSTTMLVSVLKDMMGFQDAATYSNQTIQSIKKYLDEGKPVIVPVTRVYQGSILGHFALIKGYDENYFYLNDPGRNSTVGPTAKYSFSEFETTIWQSGKSVVVVSKSVTTTPTTNPDITPQNPGTATPTGNVRVDYYANTQLNGSVIYTEYANSFNKNWGNGGPGNNVPSDNFSARFSQQVSFTSGWYKFHYEVDDAIKIWVDDDCKVDQWGSHVLSQDSQAIYISEGSHTIKVDYADMGGEAKLIVSWYGTTSPVVTPPIVTPPVNLPTGIVDLKPTTIVYDSSQLKIGTSLLLDSGVFNSGDLDAPQFKVKWYINGTQVDSATHAAIPRECYLYNSNSYISWMPTVAGTYEIKFVVDSDNQIPELNENDNETSITLIVNGLGEPDLVPTTLIFDASQVAVGRSILIDSGITNLGSMDTKGFSIKWYSNDMMVGYGYHVGVGKNETLFSDNSSYIFTPQKAGTYKIKFVIDCDDSIIESNESNNEVTVTIVVPDSDLLVTAFAAINNGKAIDLSWSAVEDKSVGYYIYRGNQSGGESQTPLTDFPIYGIKFTDSKINASTQYYYIIKPVYSDGRIGRASYEISLTSNAQSLSKIIVMQIGNPLMMVNGTSVYIDPGIGTTPLIVENRTLVPIRAIIESLGGQVDWNSNEKSISITMDHTFMKLWVGNRLAQVNGQIIETDVSPTIINSRTLVPLRFIMENMSGYSVDWDGRTSSITLQQK